MLETKGDNSRGWVFFVDDEPEVCAAVKATLEGANLAVRCFVHPADCLAQLRSDHCGLLIMDMKMPEKDGMQLLAEAKEIIPWVPVLVVSGYCDIPTVVKAIKNGAADFIEKPLEKDSFVRKVNAMLEPNHQGIYRDAARTLTWSEKKVLRLVLQGKTNKEIARSIDRSVRTVEGHRTRLMRKLGTDSLLDLFKFGAVLGMVDLPEGRKSGESTRRLDERPNGVSEDCDPDFVDF